MAGIPVDVFPPLALLSALTIYLFVISVTGGGN